MKGLLKLKLKADFYSAVKSGDSEALDSGTSQLGSKQRMRIIMMLMVRMMMMVMMMTDAIVKCIPAHMKPRSPSIGHKKKAINEQTIVPLYRFTCRSTCREQSKH